MALGVSETVDLCHGGCCPVQVIWGVSKQRLVWFGGQEVKDPVG